MLFSSKNSYCDWVSRFMTVQGFENRDAMLIEPSQKEPRTLAVLTKEEVGRVLSVMEGSGGSALCAARPTCRIWPRRSQPRRLEQS